MIADSTFPQPKHCAKVLRILAGRRGFEPQLTDPESVVLPLDDPHSQLRSGECGVRRKKPRSLEILDSSYD